MADLRAVHFIDASTFRVGAGWIDADLLAVVRPVRLSVRDALCSACAAKVRLPHTLAVRLVDGEQYLLLGDGRHSDARDLSPARALLAAKTACDAGGHKPLDYVTATGLALVPSVPEAGQ